MKQFVKDFIYGFTHSIPVIKEEVKRVKKKK